MYSDKYKSLDHNLNSSAIEWCTFIGAHTSTPPHSCVCVCVIMLFCMSPLCVHSHACIVTIVQSSAVTHQLLKWRVLILRYNYNLPLHAAILQLMWAVSWVGYTDVISKPTGSGNQSLSKQQSYRSKPITANTTYLSYASIQCKQYLTDFTLQHTWRKCGLISMISAQTHRPKLIKMYWSPTMEKHPFRQKHIFLGLY
jgi:hypothetical protein